MNDHFGASNKMVRRQREGDQKMPVNEHLCQKKPVAKPSMRWFRYYIYAIRPLAVSPLDHQESELTPWGFSFVGVRP